MNNLTKDDYRMVISAVASGNKSTEYVNFLKAIWKDVSFGEQAYINEILGNYDVSQPLYNAYLDPNTYDKKKM